MFRGEPQIYGTQYMVKDGVPELWTVRDPEGLDERRAALGLEPERENRARLLARAHPGASGRMTRARRPGYRPPMRPGDGTNKLAEALTAMRDEERW